MAKKDICSSLFFFLLSLYVCWESVLLGFGTFAKPGPGFLSLLAGILLGSFALLVFFKAWLVRTLHEKEKASDAKIPWRALLITFCAMIAFTLLIEDLGFNTVTFLFIIALLLIVERKTWKISLVTAVCVALASYLIFDLLLRSQLPHGPLGF